MIIHLPNTSTADIAKTLITARDEGGQVALGRVLTCIIATRDTTEESVIQAANDASREHPMRLIVVSHPVTPPRPQPDGLDAEIRLGVMPGQAQVLFCVPEAKAPTIFRVSSMGFSSRMPPW